MSSPNPLVPQGSLLEQQAKSKSAFHVAALIVVLHVGVLGGLLILGCKREETKTPASPITDSFSSPAPIVTETNVPMVDPFATNAAAPNLAGGAVTSAPPVTLEPPVTQPPVTPVVPEAAQAAAGAEYVIKKGDIAYNLAKKNGVTLKQLQEANAGRDLGKLKVGDKIVIPGAHSALAAAAGASTHATEPAAAGDGATYLVKRGDTLTKIAKKHGVTIKAIREANGLKSNEIQAGKKLRIPASAGAAPAATEPAATPAPAPALQPTPVQLPTAVPSATPGSPTP